MLKVKKQYYITFFRRVGKEKCYLLNTVSKGYPEKPTIEEIENELNSIKDVENTWFNSNINIEIKKNYIISKAETNG